ncbi:MAG: PspC domain-containing protein [Prolixibacteraceae bacterium]
MKKTLTINISGTVFHIDEDAYEKLKNYLSKISQHFRNEDGGHEIINDIESRIAELFASKSSNTQEVINSAMVDQIIEVMGLPEEFAEIDQEFNTGQDRRFYESKRINKRLYRDPDSRVIGGVCSGLAHYLKMDKALVRILVFILILVTSGAVLLAYLILWVAVPKARTTSQKLEMRGEDINIDSIGKTVKEEFSEMKENFEKYKTSKEYQKGKEYARRAGENAQYAGREAASVITKVFGAIFLFVGFVALIGLTFGLLTASKLVGFLPEFISGPHSGVFVDHIFNESLATTLVISVFIIAGIPLLLLIYAGTKMLFNYFSNSRNVVLTALGVWLIGIIMAVGSAFGAIDVFSSEAAETSKVELVANSDTLFIQIDTEKFDVYEETKYEFNNVLVLTKGGDEVLAARPKFTIELATQNEIELKFRKSSKGNNYKEAKKNIEKIQFNYTLSGNQLVFDPYLVLSDHAKWRSQDLEMTLKLPKGKVVFLNNNLLPLIHNIENTNNTWDGDMINNYWVMQSEGLTLVPRSKSN